MWVGGVVEGGGGETLFHSANKVTSRHIYSRRLPYIYSRLAYRTADLTRRNFHKADANQTPLGEQTAGRE